MSDKILLIIKDETLTQSIVSDLVTLSMLSACVYVSGDSTFWQVVCLALFVVYLSSKGAQVKSLKFKSAEDLREYIDKQ